MIDMLTKQEILSNLKKLDLDVTQYVVISGASLVLHDLKESTHDIDLVVTKQYYETLKKQYHIQEYKNGCCKLEEDIEFFREYWPKEIDWIEGYPTASVADIIALKKQLHRSKDLEDLMHLKEIGE